MHTGILLVSFGTSQIDAIQRSIFGIETRVKEAFPQRKIYRAFTSERIIAKLRKAKLEIPDVEAALQQMQADGIRGVLVQPTFLRDGDEYRRMVEIVQKYQDQFEGIEIGSPLITNQEDYKRVMASVVQKVSAALKESGGKDVDAIVCMGHGNSSKEIEETKAGRKTADSYKGTVWKKEGCPPAYLGVMRGHPSLSDVIRLLGQENKKQICLIPFLLVAGWHAKKDMAGEDGNSWKQVLEREGFLVQVLPVSLGELKEVQDIFLERIHQMIQQMNDYQIR